MNLPEDFDYKNSSIDFGPERLELEEGVVGVLLVARFEFDYRIPLVAID